MNLTLDTHLHSCSEAALDRGGLLGSAGKEGFGVCVCECVCVQKWIPFPGQCDNSVAVSQGRWIVTY